MCLPCHLHVTQAEPNSLMPINPPIHRRHSLRLRDYDYSQAGMYFVTICTQQQACLFGEVVDGEMRLNEAGNMVIKWFASLPGKFSEIECDAIVCMPNHVHFIIANIAGNGPTTAGSDPCVCPDSPHEQISPQGEHMGSPLPRIVQWFKTMTTNEYIRGVKQLNWPAFSGKLWQRNYYEHVIRNETSLLTLRTYLPNNPRQWALDSLNPAQR